MANDGSPTWLSLDRFTVKTSYGLDVVFKKQEQSYKAIVDTPEEWTNQNLGDNIVPRGETIEPPILKGWKVGAIVEAEEKIMNELGINPESVEGQLQLTLSVADDIMTTDTQTAEQTSETQIQRTPRKDHEQERKQQRRSQSPEQQRYSEHQNNRRQTGINQLREQVSHTKENNRPRQNKRPQSRTLERRRGNPYGSTDRPQENRQEQRPQRDERRQNVPKKNERRPRESNERRHSEETQFEWINKSENNR